MIRHIVLLDLPAAHDADDLCDVMAAFAGLQAVIPGFASFEHGPNRDFEGKSQRYPYGFICTFDSQQALETYAADPRHQALGARLVGLCTGGADGIMVVDIETD